MKKKLLHAGLGMFILMFIILSTASAANLQPAAWSKSGPGTTTITTTNDGSLKLSYDLLSSSIWQGQWWNFQSTAASTENFSFNWSYDAFHSWYHAQAKVYAYAEGPNGTQTVTLYDGYGQININGAASLNLTQGYKYGFKVYGYNYDATKIAIGNLTVSVPDQVPPITSITTSPEATDLTSFWFNSDVQVTLNATDNLSGVANTYYTVNGGSQQTGTSLVIATEGQNSISYWSVDQAGNVEAMKTATVNIDKTAPVLNVTLDNNSLWSPNHKLNTIKANVAAQDQLSDVASIVLTSITSNEPDNGLGDGDTAGDIQGAELGTLDTEFSLRAERDGNGSGRIYTITYTAIDKAGNQTNATATVGVAKSKAGK